MKDPPYPARVQQLVSEIRMELDSRAFCNVCGPAGSRAVDLLHALQSELEKMVPSEQNRLIRQAVMEVVAHTAAKLIATMLDSQICMFPANGGRTINGSTYAWVRRTAA